MHARPYHVRVSWHRTSSSARCVDAPGWRPGPKSPRQTMESCQRSGSCMHLRFWRASGAGLEARRYHGHPLGRGTTRSHCDRHQYQDCRARGSRTAASPLLARVIELHCCQGLLTTTTRLCALRAPRPGEGCPTLPCCRTTKPPVQPELPSAAVSSTRQHLHVQAPTEPCLALRPRPTLWSGLVWSGLGLPVARLSAQASHPG